MSYVAGAIDFHDDFRELWIEHARWSQATFGRDEDRGPVGPLKHLAKEALEAADAPTDIEEYADCLLLLMDAIRRAGFKLHPVVKAARSKLEVNKMRTWPASSTDEPVEHIREEK